MNCMFNIGDRVIVVSECVDNNYLEGMTGEVVHIDEDSYTYNIGIEFDEKIDRGHTCDGTGRNGYCWYCSSDDLEFLVNEEEAPDGLYSAYEIIDLL